MVFSCLQLGPILCGVADRRVVRQSGGKADKGLGVTCVAGANRETERWEKTANLISPFRSLALFFRRLPAGHWRKHKVGETGATKFTETSLCFNSMIVASAAGGSSARAKDWQTEELRGRKENWEETQI